MNVLCRMLSNRTSVIITLAIASFILGLLVFLGPYHINGISLMKVTSTSNGTSVLIGASASCFSQNNSSYNCSGTTSSHTLNPASLAYLPYHAQSTFTTPLPAIFLFTDCFILVVMSIYCIVSRNITVQPKLVNVTKTLWGLGIISFLGWLPWFIAFFWFKSKTEQDFGGTSSDQPGPQFVAKWGNGFPMMLLAFVASGLQLGLIIWALFNIVKERRRSNRVNPIFRLNDVPRVQDNTAVQGAGSMNSSYSRNTAPTMVPFDYTPSFIYDLGHNQIDDSMTLNLTSDRNTEQ